MTNDHAQLGNSSRDEESHPNGVQPINQQTQKNEPGNQKEELHSNGMEQRERENRERGGTDYQEERLVQFIRQEVKQTTQVYMEATPQLHSPEALSKYKEIDPDFPNRLLAMAEREQQAHIDADLIPIKAESYSYKFAVTVLSLFPPVLVILGMVLIFNGFDSAGYIAGIAGIVGGGAQIIAQVRPRRQGRPKQKPHHADPKK